MLISELVRGRGQDGDKDAKDKQLKIKSIQIIISDLTFSRFMHKNFKGLLNPKCIACLFSYHYINN